MRLAASFVKRLIADDSRISRKIPAASQSVWGRQCHRSQSVLEREGLKLYRTEIRTQLEQVSSNLTQIPRDDRWPHVLEIPTDSCQRVDWTTREKTPLASLPLASLTIIRLVNRPAEVVTVKGFAGGGAPGRCVINFGESLQWSTLGLLGNDSVTTHLCLKAGLIDWLSPTSQTRESSRAFFRKLGTESRTTARFAELLYVDPMVMVAPKW